MSKLIRFVLTDKNKKNEHEHWNGYIQWHTHMLARA